LILPTKSKHHSRHTSRDIPIHTLLGCYSLPQSAFALGYKAVRCIQIRASTLPALSSAGQRKRIQLWALGIDSMTALSQQFPFLFILGRMLLLSNRCRYSPERYRTPRSEWRIRPAFTYRKSYAIWQVSMTSWFVMLKSSNHPMISLE